MTENLDAGDFTALAPDYSENRPDYCPSVLRGLVGLLEKDIKDVDFVDVGAGTGIWTRMVYKTQVKSVIAIEPNCSMRQIGMNDSKNFNIRWRCASAESTGLPNSSVDWLSMASSFHWANFTEATREFYRVIRPGGRFTALWNPRLIETNPTLQEIEEYLYQLNPKMKRVSSGRSGFVENLTERIWRSPYFDDLIYLEGQHTINMTPKRYLGIWRSVNDIQVQLGNIKFTKFLNFVEQKTRKLNNINATYQTRAWSARRKD